MSKFLVSVLLLSLGTMPIFSQTPHRRSSCLDTANSQADLNVCASSLARQADVARKRAYDKLVQARVSDPAALVKLKKAETSWLAYRDAYLAAAFPAHDKQQNYGSMFPMSFDLLAESITLSHVKDLDGLKFQGD
jgi:uncharacterized protein YecT (DUF1311 family)